MTNPEIVTLVLTSSLLSASLTSLINWLIQQNNYRNDYYKKILDKRLDAYSNIEALLSLLSGTTQMDDGRLCVTEFYLGSKTYTEFCIGVALSIQKSFWLSKKTNEMLMQLNVFLINGIENEIDNNKDRDNQLIELGIFYRNHIHALTHSLNEQMQEDFTSLHDVKSFMIQKSKKTDSDSEYKIEQKPLPLQKKTENDTTKYQG